MRDLVFQVRQSILERQLLREREKIVLAVSGGVDSMVLLHLLHRVCTQHGWKLVIAHFNHHLRGRSSDADERLVRKTADRLGLPLIVGAGEVKSFAREHKLSLEMAARQLRHEFLARTARKVKAPRIALGHHADDQLELFFLRLLRGTGTEGLGGMKWISPSPVANKIMLVRPLLDCSRAELEEFARSQEIPFREDLTNKAFDFQRNRIRHELLPLLARHYQPALLKTTLRSMELLQADSDFLTVTARDWLHEKTPPFAKLHVAVQRRVLQLQLFDLGLKTDFQTIEQLRLPEDFPLTLSPGIRVCRDTTGTVQLLKQPTEEQFDDLRQHFNLTAAAKGRAAFGSCQLTWQVVPRNTQSKRLHIADHGSGGHNQSLSWRTRFAHGREYFDADKIGPTIALRHWQPGDRFQPSGMPATVKLQDLFGNHKVPRNRRHEATIATRADGQIFWVQGLRIAEQFKLDKKTARILIWCWQTS